MTWIPASQPPLIYQDEFGWFSSRPVLVWTQSKGGFSKILVAMLEKWDEDDFPAWYSGCSEHWNLHDTVKFWMPLPNPPKDQP
mgnify:FL=1